MGVEPTADVSATPATGFEDRDAHRDASAPMLVQYYPEKSFWSRSRFPLLGARQRTARLTRRTMERRVLALAADAISLNDLGV